MKKSLLIVSLFFLACSDFSKEEKEYYLSKGREISNEVNSLLSSNVYKKANQEGFDKAIDFCNVNSDSLIIKISKQENVYIKRISDKNRSTKNKPLSNEEELMNKYILGYKNDTIIKDYKNINYYKPLFVNSFCLNCHGDESLMDKNIKEIIGVLYPNDKAINYKDGDFRGLIKIVFNKN